MTPGRGSDVAMVPRSYLLHAPDVHERPLAHAAPGGLQHIWPSPPQHP
ncbi:MAG: hypothetical protein HYV09_40140 [Deltaproteobacteria bacterium]|nr:hypothetical protein [Deltaproteobacteria bacterium]